MDFTAHLWLFLLVFGSPFNLCEGWLVVFKVAVGESVEPGTTLYDLWTSTNTLNDDSAGRASVKENYFVAAVPSYKSHLVDRWETSNIKNVKVAMYDSGQEVVSIIFNNSRSDNKMSWFSEDHILQAGQRYSDLNPTKISNCSIEGDQDQGRRFIIASGERENCEQNTGWMVVVDTDRPGACHWDFRDVPPFFLYSSNTSHMSMNDMAVAEAFVVFVDDCALNPCKFGGTCSSVLGEGSCSCVDQYYGRYCETVCPCEFGHCIAVPQGSSPSKPSFMVGDQSLICNCSDGYEGIKCEQSIDDCASNPCENGGVCTDKNMGFTCACVGDYYGSTCQIENRHEEHGTSGALIAIGVSIPLGIIVIVLIIAYAIYIKRNPDGYGRATIYKHSALARDFVRRSFRRMSGRKTRQRKDASEETTKDNRKIISSDDVSVGYVNTGFRDGDDGFGDCVDSGKSYSRQDSEHIDLSPNDQSVIFGGGPKPPPSSKKYLEPRVNAYAPGRSYSASPRPDTEHSYPDSSQESNTSGSLYNEMNPGLTPDYGPAYKPEKSSRYNDKSVQQQASSPGQSELQTSKATPRQNNKDRYDTVDQLPTYESVVSNQNYPDVKQHLNDRYNPDVKPRSNERYNPDAQPHTDDRYNPDVKPRSNDRYNQDVQLPSNDRYNPDVQVQSNDRYNPDVLPRSKDRYNPDVQRSPNDRYNPDIQRPSNDRYNPDVLPRSGDRYNTDMQSRPTDQYNTPRLDDRYNTEPHSRPTTLDYTSDSRSRHTNRHHPDRGNHPSPGYSPGTPVSPGHHGQHPGQRRSPSQGSPQDTVVFTGVDPVNEIAI